MAHGAFSAHDPCRNSKVSNEIKSVIHMAKQLSLCQAVLHSMSFEQYLNHTCLKFKATPQSGT